MASEGNFISEFVIPMFPKGSIGVCLDIGAYDPEWINNSIELEELGWTCYCIEPNPHCIPALKAKRKHVLEYAIGDKNEDNVDFYVYHVDTAWAGPLGEAAGTGIKPPTDGDKALYPITMEKVKIRTFEWLMENEVHEDYIDVISIDVEGSEMEILSTIDVSRWKPKVIICENIGEFKEQHDWFERMGFGRIKRVAFNDIYVRLSEIQLKVGK
jgi:FkbM family methyltransferase